VALFKLLSPELALSPSDFKFFLDKATVRREATSAETPNVAQALCMNWKFPWP
jgi:hypothetical protein